MFAFRRHSERHQFQMANGAKFEQLVHVNTTVAKEHMRFGIDQDHIDRFIQRMLTVEYEGRKFRTKYQIPMVTGSPQAENFLWTILGNKVSSTFLILVKIHPCYAFLNKFC